MKPRRFIQCDVFTPVPTQGNALAVVVDSEGLSDTQMQQFAAWTNLAETTFLLVPDDPVADYKVRIFTPMREMPFAGHPTLGSCAAWIHSGGVAKEATVVRQQCAVGIIEIDTSNKDILAFTAPPTTIEAMSESNFEAIVNTLEIPRDAILQTAQLNNGPLWQVFHLASSAAVLALDSSRVRWPAFNSIGFIGAHPAGADSDYEVRMLAPSSGMSEDPITGSLNAALAHWMHADGRLSAPVNVAQGTSIGRCGRVLIRPNNETGAIQIGGQVHMLVEGVVTL